MEKKKNIFVLKLKNQLYCNVFNFFFFLFISLSVARSLAHSLSLSLLILKLDLIVVEGTEVAFHTCPIVNEVKIQTGEDELNSPCFYWTLFFFFFENHLFKIRIQLLRQFHNFFLSAFKPTESEWFVNFGA